MYGINYIHFDSYSDFRDLLKKKVRVQIKIALEKK